MVYDGICTEDRLCIAIYLPAFRRFSGVRVPGSIRADDSPAIRMWKKKNKTKKKMKKDFFWNDSIWFVANDVYNYFSTASNY